MVPPPPVKQPTIMHIETTEETGFCFGVKRSLKIIQEAVAKYGRIETLGPLVHNKRVVDSLSQRGVGVVSSPDEITSSVAVICSHGMPPAVFQKLKGKGLKVIDSTCPNVRKAQKAAKELSEVGFGIIVFGDPNHPEVKGILGWAKGKGLAISDSDAISRLDEPPHRVGLLSQTTRNPEEFARFISTFIVAFLPQIEELRVINTLCNVTQKRQAEAVDLAKRVNLMIVVGDRRSANTRELAKICSSVGTETHHVETAAEIEQDWLRSGNLVGVTTGTSIPDEVTEEVMLRLEEIQSSLSTK